MVGPKKMGSEGKAKGQNQNHIQPVLPPKSSYFLQLPRELRDLIYVCLFASTRLTSGQRSITQISTKTMKPAPNSLAILRTCRQINHEVDPLWLRHVLFSFENGEDLLDKLSACPLDTLSQVRHARTGGRPLMLQPIGDNDDVYYQLAWALKLIPGLCLDKLTVFGSCVGEIAYDTLEGLLEHGNGWKELHFLTPNSEMLGFAKEIVLIANPYWRKPQPSTWDEMLRRRDRANSGASVTIYRSTQSDAPGAVMKTCTRRIFEQKVPLPADLGTYGLAEDEEMMGEKGIGKELLVIVKRGGTDTIMEKDGFPYLLEGDIRRWAHGLNWPQIRRQCIDLIMDEDEDYDYFTGRDDEVEVDSYEDVDEYEWNPVD